jgi:2,3-bisphosphoglycerate-independent phosphoglycerate mutase
MNAAQNAPMILLILDGWGHREESKDNAIFHADTPVWDELWHNAPHTLIGTSGLDVGLPKGQMGNSEVGHMSLGSGRVIYQNITRIDKAIAEGSFFENPGYTQAVDKAVANDKAVHIIGLLSPGGVHSHESHIQAMAELAAKRGAEKLFIHAILDGRDVPPRSAEHSLLALENKLKELGKGKIASVIGRYYAMDRDNRWDRVEQAYQLFTQSEGLYSAQSAQDALSAAYQRDENDEFVSATSINCPHDSRINDGDAVIFMNFRADRAREITRAFVDKDFKGFERKVSPDLADFVMTTEYSADIKTTCAYPPTALSNVLGEYLESQGKRQLRIAETEKYAHVTFFFSGGREALFEGEERILIASPDVATYDLQPEMSAPEVTDKLCEAITSGKFDTIICNYANGDMVGHTGIYDAAIKAVEAVDACLGKVIAAAQSVGGDILITADHGNCEQMRDYDANQPHTQHTTEKVPLVYVGNKALEFGLNDGTLSDIAPTMLELMELEQPAEMTGRMLLRAKQL